MSINNEIQEHNERIERLSDTARLDWLGGDPDRVESVRWTMINEDMDAREAIDHLIALR